jgi:hypothetical protein
MNPDEASPTFRIGAGTARGGAVTVLGLATPVTASPIFFRVDQPETSGPPYPSAPAVDMTLSNVTTPFIGSLDLNLHSVTLNTTARIDASAPGTVDVPGTMAFADVQRRATPASRATPVGGRSICDSIC